MGNILTKKLFWASVAFLVMLAIATHFILRQLRIDKSPVTNPPADGAVNVQSDENIDEVVENRIIYTETGFSPKEISIAADRGLGCSVNVINRSNRSLNLGLSPHKEAKDPGREYPPIAQGDRLLFDPRFTGFTELSFHDHERPALEFTVKFDKSCR